MEFIEDAEFTNEWFSLGLTDDDMWVMQKEISDNPTGATICPGMAGARKIRIPIANRGKRGGARTIYYYLSESNTVFLLWVYAKNETAELSPIIKHLISATIHEIKRK